MRGPVLGSMFLARPSVLAMTKRIRQNSSTVDKSYQTLQRSSDAIHHCFPRRLVGRRPFGHVERRRPSWSDGTALLRGGATTLAVGLGLLALGQKEHVAAVLANETATRWLQVVVGIVGEVCWARVCSYGFTIQDGKPDPESTHPVRARTAKTEVPASEAIL